MHLLELFQIFDVALIGVCSKGLLLANGFGQIHQLGVDLSVFYHRFLALILLAGRNRLLNQLAQINIGVMQLLLQNFDVFLLLQYFAIHFLDLGCVNVLKN